MEQRFGILFDPAVGQVGRTELLFGDAQDRARLIDDDGLGPGRALVDGQDVGHGDPVLVSLLTAASLASARGCVAAQLASIFKPSAVGVPTAAV